MLSIQAQSAKQMAVFDNIEPVNHISSVYNYYLPRKMDLQPRSSSTTYHSSLELIQFFLWRYVLP
jgi:hypothetical protein